MMNKIQKIGLVTGLVGVLFGTNAKADLTISDGSGTTVLSDRNLDYLHISGLILLYDGYEEALKDFKKRGKIGPNERELPPGFYGLLNEFGYEGIVPEGHDFDMIIRELSEISGKRVTRADFQYQNRNVMKNPCLLKPGTKFKYVTRVHYFNIF